MSAESKTINRKKRDASYYREYRRKRKIQTAKIIPLPVANAPKGLRLNSLSEPHSGMDFKNSILTVFVVLLTGILIQLSAPFYLRSHTPLMAYALASVVELSLLFLISVPVDGIWDRLGKRILVVVLSAYALLPIALNPIFEAQQGATAAQTQKLQIEEKIQSIRSEIQSRNSRVQIFMERGRLTAAQGELQAVAKLENELRNMISTVQPVAISTLELHASYLLALQRLLLMLCNLFFAHRMVDCWKKGIKKNRFNCSSAVTFSCAT